MKTKLVLTAQPVIITVTANIMMTKSKSQLRTKEITYHRGGVDGLLIILMVVQSIVGVIDQLKGDSTHIVR